jgi:hypothetical protein
MLWKDVLIDWSLGISLKYSSQIENRFFYETSPLDNNFKNVYKSKFIKTNKFDNIRQDYSSFLKYINESDNKYATSFLNKSRDCLLVIPMPRKRKNFTTIKDFIDNASEAQQSAFWRTVYEKIMLLSQKYHTIHISTHGLGVHYFHLRISLTPKYFITQEFIP